MALYIRCIADFQPAECIMKRHETKNLTLRHTTQADWDSNS